MDTEGFDAQFVDRSCGLLRRQLERVRPIINAFTGNRVVPVSDWIRNQHHKQREPLRGFQDMSTHVAVALAASAMDNTTALADMLDEPDGRIYIWAYLTLARAVVESATQFAYLTDCHASPTQRILRAAATEVSGRMEERKLAAEFSDLSAERQLAKESNRLERRLTRAGITYRLDRNGKKRIGLERDSESVLFDINITEESAQRMTRNVAPYRIGSAVTHSAWWFLASSLRRDDREIRPTPDPNVVINAVSLTLEALEIMADACASETQADAVERLHRSTDRRMQILTRYSEVPPGISARE